MPNGRINAGNLNIDATASIGLVTASLIDADTAIIGTIKPPPGQGSVIIEGNDPCCVYVTGSNSNEAIATSSIEPKHTTHDNQGQCSVINGGNLHSIDANTQYGGIQSGFSSSLSQQYGSNIAGGIRNKIKEGTKGLVSASAILGGADNTIQNGEFSSILGGSLNVIVDHSHSFVLGHSIEATASCTSFVNHLNIKNVDDAQPTDQLLVRHSSGLVRQGPTITEVSGSTIQVPGLVNPDRDVYVTGSNSVAAIATSSIQPFFMPNNTNNGACSVISSGENNSIVSNSINTSPSYSGIFSGEGNYISGSDYSSIETGEGNFLRMTGSLSASVDYVNEYAKYNTIQNGEDNFIENQYKSNVKTVSLNAVYSSSSDPSIDFVAAWWFNRGIEASDPYPIGSIPYSGNPPAPAYLNYNSWAFREDLVAFGKTTLYQGPYAILNYHNVIQGGKNNAIRNWAYFNIIGNGEKHRMVSYFYQTSFATSSPWCAAGNRPLYFLPSHHNFIGNGEKNQIKGASYSGIVAGRCNAIEFDLPLQTSTHCIQYETPPPTGSSITNDPSLSFIGAGCLNRIGMTTKGGIVAGENNRIQRDFGCSFIGAGYNNKTSLGMSWASFIGAGQSNLARKFAGVVAGHGNKAYGTRGFIGAGHANTVDYNSPDSIIGAGRYNCVVGRPDASNGILAGICNRIASTIGSSIVGGQNNCVGVFGNRSDHSFIGGGCCNTISGSRFSAILGGKQNVVESCLYNTFIVGSNITATRACTIFVNRNKRSLRSRST